MKYVIGIDAGGTKVAYGLFDSSGAIVDRAQHPTDSKTDGPAFCKLVLQTIRRLLDKHNLQESDLLGVGFCMPSFILQESGHILMTASMPGIKDFPMLEFLKQRLKTKIVLDNDANAAALAEHRRGAGRGARHMMYIVVGTGLGGGIIIDGKLFHGSYGWAGECGHMLATPDEGILCGCENKGCYMSYTTGRFLSENVKNLLDKGIKSILTPETASGYTLKSAYAQGDELAIKIVEQMAFYVAVCTFNIYQLLNINTYVFGGGLIDLGDALMVRVRNEFDRLNKLNLQQLPIHFKTAELKHDFGIIGAYELVV